MKAMLTLNKADLLEKLNARRDELKSYLDGLLKSCTDELARREDKDEILASLAEWHQTVALGLADGTITLTAKGSLKNAPAKPSANAGLSSQRYHDYNDPKGWPRHRLERAIEKHSDIEDEMLKPLTTAIELVGLSVGETVEVDAANYQDLLNGNGHYRGRHW